MKILRLALKNLNSLRGEHRIDFSQAPFKDHGLFAIVGPTGAGKSTLLDAICLALYHQTPRLGKLTHQQNAIMSRHTHNCFAEVEFELKGRIYRAKWSQHRASRTNNLQAPSVELAELPAIGSDEGRILCTKPSEKLKEIETLTGLNFTRFTQSILLAQGRFAEFLHADAKLRAELLEQLTGTEIYSRISSNTFERYKTSQSQFEALQQQAGGVMPWDELERAAHRAELDAVQAHIQALEAEQSRLQRAQQWHHHYAEATQQLQRAHADAEAANDALNHHAENFARLDASEAARALMPYAQAQQQAHIRAAASQAHCDTLRDQQIAHQHAQEVAYWRAHILSQALATQAADVQRQTQNRVHALNQDLKNTSHHAHLITQLAHWQHQIRYLQNLQQQITEQQHIIKRCEHALTNARTAKTQQEEQVAQARAALQHAQSHYDATVTALTAQHGQALADPSARQAARDQANQYLTTLTRLMERASDLDAAQQQATSIAQHITVSTRTLNHTQNQYDVAHALAQAKAETVNDKQIQLEQTRYIASFEEARTQLHSGEPCPLCGATAHPYAQSHPLATNPITVAEAALQRAQQEAEAARQAEHSAETQRQRAQREYDLLNSQQVQHLETIQTLRTRGMELAQTEAPALIDTWNNLTWMNAHHAAQTAQIHALNTAIEKVENAAEQCATATQQLHATEREQNALVLKLTLQEAEQQQAQQQYQQWALDYQQHAQQLCAEITARGFAPPMAFDMQAQDWLTQRQHDLDTFVARQAEQAELDKQLLQQQQQLDLAQERAQTWATVWQQTGFNQGEPLPIPVDIAATLQACETNIQKLRQEQDALTGEAIAAQADKQRDIEQVQDAQQHWRNALVQSIFLDESAFRAACLPPEEHAELLALKQKLDANQRETHAVLEAARRHLAQLNQDSQRPSESAADISAAVENNQSLLAEKNQQQGALQDAWQRDQARQQQHAELATALAEAQQSLALWGQLNTLIGSADGTKYRKFAQGLTLSHLVELTNRRLDHLQGRYILRHKAGEELALEIIDTWQSDACRDVNTLSGGESFLVSLGLALGLSDLVSHEISIDSLFLDEGFGTLDAETLEVALNALDQLNASGKSIGVISHVSGLKERIPVQIQVIPTQGAGISTLKIESDA